MNLLIRSLMISALQFKNWKLKYNKHLKNVELKIDNLKINYYFKMVEVKKSIADLPNIEDDPRYLALLKEYRRKL